MKLFKNIVAESGFDQVKLSHSQAFSFTIFVGWMCKIVGQQEEDKGHVI